MIRPLHWALTEYLQGDTVFTSDVQPGDVAPPSNQPASTWFEPVPMRFRAALLTLVLATPAAFAQQDPTDACFVRLSEERRLDVIRAKLSLLGSRTTTFAMLADESVPTAEEREAIATWATARADCMKDGDEYRARYWPAQASSLAVEAESRMTAEAVELFQQKINFGEFNKRRQAIANELAPRRAALRQQAQDANDRAQQAQQAQQSQERARRQAEMSILLQPFKTEPLTLTPTTRPTVTTNCSQLGNQVQCTTR